ncbi:MAG: hypothetical protein KDH96_08215 [Candidatus Riesia sp.]|nr:hypothetical protein [Candidatus Riesia sp.]
MNNVYKVGKKLKNEGPRRFVYQENRDGVLTRYELKRKKYVSYDDTTKVVYKIITPKGTIDTLDEKHWLTRVSYWLSRVEQAEKQVNFCKKAMKRSEDDYKKAEEVLNEAFKNLKEAQEAMSVKQP